MIEKDIIQEPIIDIPIDSQLKTMNGCTRKNIRNKMNATGGLLQTEQPKNKGVIRITLNEKKHSNKIAASKSTYKRGFDKESSQDKL
jgi:hypothetical protein